MSVPIEIELDIDAQCKLLEYYVKDNLSEPSVDVFIESVGHDILDLNKILLATGKAVLNEAIINVIKIGIENDENDERSETGSCSE